VIVPKFSFHSTPEIPEMIQFITKIWQLATSRKSNSEAAQPSHGRVGCRLRWTMMFYT
jgi:hypothetical protein